MRLRILSLVTLAAVVMSGAEKTEALHDAVARAMTAGKLPGAVLWVEHGAEAAHWAQGDRAVAPAREPMTEDTIFDAASLTKVVATAPSVMLLIERGRVKLDAPVRNGAAFTPDGLINVRNERYRTDKAPLVEGLDNYTCRHFSRAYLRHLVMANEILASTLLSLHNLHFYLDLVAQARAHIEAGDFAAWSKTWIERYESGEAAGS